MNYIENVYICLTAPVLVAQLFMRRQGRVMLLFLLSGMTACLFSAYVSTFIAGIMETDTQHAAFDIAPTVEEILKVLPVLFFLLVFEPERGEAVHGALMVSVGFATFENVCYLTSYGSDDLLRLLVRGFGTGAMHVVCGRAVSVGVFFLWDRAWLRAVGGFALLCAVITFHAIFNVLVNQTGAVFWVGSVLPLTMVLAYFLIGRSRRAGSPTPGTAHP